MSNELKYILNEFDSLPSDKQERLLETLNEKIIEKRKKILVRNEIKNNKPYYIVNYSNLGFPSRLYNVKNYEVVKGEFVNVEKSLEFKTEKFGNIVLSEYTQLFEHEVLAKNFAYKMTFSLLKGKVIEQLKEENFPSYPVSPNFDLRSTSNPLRFGERNLSITIQTNTVNNTVSVQKIIQLISVTMEDISMIAAILELIAFVNDYTKKLLGKYAIIELSSIYILLKGSKNYKGLKDFNNDYANNEFLKLEDEIKKLEKKYNFKGIRNKIAAHKSADLNLNEYIDHWRNITGEVILKYFELFNIHINEVLTKYYPDEKSIYFIIPQHPLPGLFSERIESDYKPFHNFEM